MESKTQQHVVAVPMPAQGHLNPLMRFCQLLAKHDDSFIITFVDFDPIHARLQEVRQQAPETPPPASSAANDTGSNAAASEPPRIRRVRIPIDGLDLSKNFNVSFRQFYAALPSMAPYLEQLILSLNSHGPPVTCLLSDFHVTIPTQDVADRLGIPRIVLYPGCAARLLFTQYLSQGHGNLSVQAVMEASVVAGMKRGEVWLEGLSGLPTFLYEDIPHFKHVEDDTTFLWETTKVSWQMCNARAHGVVVNSLEGLEESTFNELSKACNVPVYDVGLWVENLSKDNSTSLWKEDTSCLTWLDKQANSSVLYISFGSIGVLSRPQFEEFQDGLISSKKTFLWVFRPGLVHDIDYSSSMASIMCRSHGRALVITWAPQLQVLSHPSIGGFLTHCGWNSTSESIAHGVPMLCWPYFADQPINARCIIDKWKVGLGFKSNNHKNGLIERGEVERVIRALMEGEEGKLVRQNAAHLKDTIQQCFLGSGSSHMKMKGLISSLH